MGVDKNEGDFHKSDDLKDRPGAWERFERAVDVVLKSGPKHRQAQSVKQKERPPSKGRVHKGRTRD